MKKILFILPNTGSAGDNQVILNLIDAIPSEHYRLFFLPNEKGNAHSEYQKFGKIFYPFIDQQPLIRRVLRRFFRKFYFQLKVYYCRKTIKEVAPDILYINTVNENEYSKEAVKSNIKRIVHIHEMGDVVTSRMSEQWITNLFDKADIAISVADTVTHFYHENHKVDTSMFATVHGPASLKRLSETRGDHFDIGPVKSGTVVIGAAGSLIHRKGVDIFLKACGILKHSLPQQKFRFLWLGDQANVKPDYLRCIDDLLKAQQLEEDFQFIPFTKSVRTFYESLDIFVLPSRIEAFPLVILEAMLSEKPVVAMNVGGVREVVDSDNGYLVKDRTPEGLAEGIMHFINNPDFGKMAGQNGKKRVMENFEAKVQVKKWVDILNSI